MKFDRGEITNALPGEATPGNAKLQIFFVTQVIRVLDGCRVGVLVLLIFGDIVPGGVDRYHQGVIAFE